MSTSRRWTLIFGTAALATTVAVGCGGDEPQNGTSSTGGGGDATTTSTTGSSSGGGQDGAGGAGQGGSGGAGQGGAGQGGGQGGAGEGGAGGGGQGGSGQGGSASASDSIDVNGKIIPGAGKSVPPAADVIIGWSVSTGPDYIYGFGSGNSTGATFQVSLDKTPPTEALNASKVGIGLVILYPAGMMPPEGKLTEATLNQSIGAAGDYAIIYKAPGAPNQSWISKFPEGYSCGKGAPPEPGSNFESFTPVDCSEITIIVDDIDKIDFVNWT